jgi:hypothetical protein
MVPIQNVCNVQNLSVFLQGCKDNLYTLTQTDAVQWKKRGTSSYWVLSEFSTASLADDAQRVFQ